MVNGKMLILSVELPMETLKVVISVDTTKTKNGFYHEARGFAVKNLGLPLSDTTLKVRNSYINRTWEKYEYQAVLRNFISKINKKFLGLNNASGDNARLKVIKNALLKKVENQEFRLNLNLD
jgi:hypothetical protein